MPMFEGWSPAMVSQSIAAYQGLPDVTLVCQDGGKVGAQRVLLALHSSLLREVLEEEEEATTLLLPNLPSPLVTKALSLLHTGKVEGAKEELHQVNLCLTSLLGTNSALTSLNIQMEGDEEKVHEESKDVENVEKVHEESKDVENVVNEEKRNHDDVTGSKGPKSMLDSSLETENVKNETKEAKETIPTVFDLLDSMVGNDSVLKVENCEFSLKSEEETNKHEEDQVKSNNFDKYTRMIKSESRTDKLDIDPLGTETFALKSLLLQNKLRHEEQQKERKRVQSKIYKAKRRAKNINSADKKPNNEKHEKKILSCNKCTYVTMERYALERHQQRENKREEKVAEQPKKYVKPLVRKESLKETKLKPTVICLKASIDKVTPAEPKIYYCFLCKYRTKNSFNLKRHQENVHDKVQYCCDVDGCDFKTSQPGYVVGHKKVYHEGVRENCPDCGKDFTSKQSLQTHLRVQHQGIRYPCDRCDFTSGTIAYMNNHIQVKHEGVTFSCEEDGCSYETKDRSNLRHHKRKHKGHPNNQIYKCKTLVTSGFSNSKPCSFDTTQRGDLLAHKKEIHGQTHLCKKCGYSTNQAGHLNAHINAIHEGGKFDCQDCSFVTGFKADLKRHFKTMHLKEYEAQQIEPDNK